MSAADRERIEAIQRRWKSGDVVFLLSQLSALSEALDRSRAEVKQLEEIQGELQHDWLAERERVAALSEALSAAQRELSVARGTASLARAFGKQAEEGEALADAYSEKLKEERDAASAVLAQTQEQFAIHMQEWNEMREALTACQQERERQVECERAIIESAQSWQKRAEQAEADLACQQQGRDTFKRLSSEQVEAIRKLAARDRHVDSEQVDFLLSQLTACRAQGEAMRAALHNLVTKLDAMEKPLNGLAAIGHIHGMPYNGPNWADEMAAARAALSSTPTEPSK